jgi:hypothetical protein
LVLRAAIALTAPSGGQWAAFASGVAWIASRSWLGVGGAWKMLLPVPERADGEVCGTGALQMSRKARVGFASSSTRVRVSFTSSSARVRAQFSPSSSPSRRRLGPTNPSQPLELPSPGRRESRCQTPDVRTRCYAAVQKTRCTVHMQTRCICIAFASVRTRCQGGRHRVRHS